MWKSCVYLYVSVCTLNRSQNRRTVFEAAIDETVKDIDCHGTLSQIRVGFLFGRKYQHEQVDQKKRDQITADADSTPSTELISISA